MSLQSAPFWWVVCDNCGARDDYGEFSALDDPDQAIELTLDGGEWTENGEGKHHCGHCPPLYKCEECGKDAGPDAPDRDHMCQSCADRIAAEMAPDLSGLSP